MCRGEGLPAFFPKNERGFSCHALLGIKAATFFEELKITNKLFPHHLSWDSVSHNLQFRIAQSFPAKILNKIPLHRSVLTPFLRSNILSIIHIQRGKSLNRQKIHF